MIKYAYTILYVSSVVESLEFYEKAFGFERKFLTEEHDYGEIRSGETIIAFASKQLANSNLYAFSVICDLLCLFVYLSVHCIRYAIMPCIYFPLFDNELSIAGSHFR